MFRIPLAAMLMAALGCSDPAPDDPPELDPGELADFETATDDQLQLAILLSVGEYAGDGLLQVELFRLMPSPDGCLDEQIDGDELVYTADNCAGVLGGTASGVVRVVGDWPEDVRQPQQVVFENLVIVPDDAAELEISGEAGRVFDDQGNLLQTVADMATSVDGVATSLAITVDCEHIDDRPECQSADGAVGSIDGLGEFAIDVAGANQLEIVLEGQQVLRATATPPSACLALDLDGEPFGELCLEEL